MRIAYLLFPFIFMFLFTSCLKDPGLINIEKVTVLGCNGEVLDIETKTVISNPNKYDIRLNNLEMQYLYDGKLIGKGAVAGDVLLRRNQDTTVTVNSALDLRVLSEAFPLMTKSDSFSLTTIIKARVSSLNFARELKK